MIFGKSLFSWTMRDMEVKRQRLEHVREKIRQTQTIEDDGTVRVEWPNTKLEAAADRNELAELERDIAQVERFHADGMPWPSD